MSYGELISMGLSALTSKSQFKLDKATKEAQKTIGTAQLNADNLLSETNANAENVLRGENNTLLAAKAALANMQRSGHNEATLKTAGNRYNASSTNLLRIADANTQGSLERRIQSAEQQGAITAQAAATGTGGSSARMLKMALAATSARRETQTETRQGQRTYDMLADRAGLMSGAVSSLDEGQTFAAIDVTKSIAHKSVPPMWAADYLPSQSAFLIQSLMGKAGGALGSYLESKGSQYTPPEKTSEKSDSPSNPYADGNGGGGNGYYSSNTSNAVDETSDGE